MVNTRTKDFKRIEGRLNALTADYSRKFLINANSPDIDSLLFSLTHRFGAIQYHTGLIEKHLQKIVDEAINDGVNFMRKHIGIDFQLAFLFDDLVFNMMSFYDYFASYILYIAYDEEIRGRAKGYDPLIRNEHKYDHLDKISFYLRWTAVAKMCKPKPEQKQLIGEPNKFVSTEFSKIIHKHDQKFIEPLRKFRDRVIHNNTAHPSIKFKFVGGDENIIEFKTLSSLLEKFKSYSENFEEAVNNLSEDFLESVEDIIFAIDAYIEENRRVPKGEEFFLYEHEIEEYKKKGIID